MSDWYGVSRKAIVERGGQPLLSRGVTGSLADLLARAYPEFTWEKRKFVEAGHTPRGFWNDVGNIRDLADSIGKGVGVTEVGQDTPIYTTSSLLLSCRTGIECLGRK